MGREAELLAGLATSLAKLPIAALSIGGVTIERGGAVMGDDPRLLAIAKRDFT